jgi:hypothetical protein
MMFGIVFRAAHRQAAELAIYVRYNYRRLKANVSNENDDDFGALASRLRARAARVGWPSPAWAFGARLAKAAPREGMRKIA